MECLNRNIDKFQGDSSDDNVFDPADAGSVLEYVVRFQLLKQPSCTDAILKAFMSAATTAYKSDIPDTPKLVSRGLAHLMIAGQTPAGEINQFVELVTGERPKSLKDLFSCPNNADLWPLQEAVMSNIGGQLNSKYMFDYALQCPEEHSACVFNWYLATDLSSVRPFINFIRNTNLRPYIERKDLWRLASAVAKDKLCTAQVNQLDPPLADLALIVSSLRQKKPRSYAEDIPKLLDAAEWHKVIPLLESRSNKIVCVKYLSSHSFDLSTQANRNGYYDVCFHIAENLNDPKLLLGLSNILVNSARLALPSPVAFEMYTLSMDLEHRLPSLSRYYIDKVRRATLASDLVPHPHHLNNVLDGLARAFALEQPRLKHSHSKDWDAINGTIIKLKHMDRMIDLLLEKSAVGPDFLMIAQYSLLEAASPWNFGTYMDRTMPLIKHRTIDHHELYFRSTKSCWSVAELLDLNCKQGYMMLAMTTNSIAQKHHYCKLALEMEGPIAASTPRFNLSELIWSYGFVDLSRGTDDYFWLFRQDRSEAPNDRTYAKIIAAESDVPEASVSRLLALEKEFKKSHKHTPHLVDCLVRLYLFNAAAGNSGDAVACLKTASSVAERAGLTVRHIALDMIVDQLHEQLKLGSRLNPTYDPEAVGFAETLSVLYTARGSDHALKMRIYEAQHERAIIKLSSDPLYSVLSEVALSEPCATFVDSSERAVENKRAFLPLQDLTNQLQSIETKGLNWKDRRNRARLLESSQLLLENLHVSSETVPEVSCSLEVEKCKRSFLRAARVYNGHNKLPDTDNIKLSDLPDGVVALTINLDIRDNLVIGRYQRSVEPFTITLPTSRMMSLSGDEQELTLSDGIKELLDTVAPSPASAAAKAGDPEAIRMWWDEQYSKEDKLRSLLRKMEESWLGGFRGLFDPFDRQDTSHFESLTASLESKITRSISYSGCRPQSSSKVTDSFKIRPEFVSLFASLASGPTMNHEESAIEDLLYFVLDNLRLQGVQIDYDELDVDQLVVEVQGSIHSYRDGQASMLLEAVDEFHIVIIPDNACHQVPWESFPCMEDVPASRALSLASLIDMSKSTFYSYNRPNPLKGVYYVVNPENDLPNTQATFEAQFKLRKWDGLLGERPQESDITRALAENSCFIYIGHNTGMSYVRGSVLRATNTETCPPVMLLGCGSAKLNVSGDEFDGRGAVTDYAVGGCPLFIGNLWNVKDKDLNRFSTEMLGRIFDDGEEVCRALMESRKGSLLRYLTGAAPVVFGLPTTLT